MPWNQVWLPRIPGMIHFYMKINKLNLGRPTQEFTMHMLQKLKMFQKPQVEDLDSALVKPLGWGTFRGFCPKSRNPTLGARKQLIPTNSKCGARVSSQTLVTLTHSLSHNKLWTVTKMTIVPLATLNSKNNHPRHSQFGLHAAVHVHPMKTVQSQQLWHNSQLSARVQWPLRKRFKDKSKNAEHTLNALPLKASHSSVWEHFTFCNAGKS